MTLPRLDARRGRDLIGRFAGQRVLVVGDAMLDRFIVGRVTRISPEAPVPVVRFQSEHVRLGGAANVAHNIAVLGGKPSLVAVIGADEGAARLKSQLTAAGIELDGLVEDPSRPTTEKVRIVTERNQQVARLDYEQDGEVTGEIERMLAASVARHGSDAGVLLVSDYLKGAVTPTVFEAVVAIASKSLAAAGRAGITALRVPLVVDPKIPHLGVYSGATLVTPNHHEAETATHLRVRTDDEAREAAREFRLRVQCEAVLITRGDQGIWLSSPDSEGSIPAVAREVSDVTGAGDTVVATLALALAAGATMAEAAMLANHAAGIVVGKFGPATVTADELVKIL
jgi:D-glycero-beta-D-manno-heptose-7-phosphate kinase